MMSLPHFLLALLVVLIWGINFLFVKLGLDEISPIMLCAIRFMLASIPAIFFIKRPAMPLRTVASYGLVVFALQFSLLFMGMRAGMTPGMASLIMQVQIFFSMFFAAAFLGEIPYLWQIAGALISFIGIGIVAMHTDKSLSYTSILLILAAAAAWGYGNLIIKKTRNVNMISLVVWSRFIAAIPMIALSLMTEGTHSIAYTYQHLTWKGIVSVLYIVYASTWVGYGVWNWLLGRYPMGTVVPFTLLVPIVGIMSSALVLGEPLQSWKLMAGAFVISGLCLNLLGVRIFSARKKLLNDVLNIEPGVVPEKEIS